MISSLGEQPGHPALEVGAFVIGCKTFRGLLYEHAHYLSQGLVKQRDRLRVILNFSGSSSEC